MNIQIYGNNPTASLINDAPISLNVRRMEEHQPTTRAGVHFSDKTQITTFPQTTTEEAPLYWYTDEELQDMAEDVNYTVKRCLKKCGNYCVAMDRIAAKCSQVDSQQTSITALLDPTVLMHIANAKARGMEHHISPLNYSLTCQQGLQEVLAMQDHSGREENVLAVARRYKELSQRARLMAKTMGDGDALVADRILERKATQTTVETKDKETESFCRPLPLKKETSATNYSPRKSRTVPMRDGSDLRE